MKVKQIICEYQNYIDQVPVAPNTLYTQACGSDQITIDSWRSTWEKNIIDNKKRFGNFKDHSIGKFHGYARHKPVIIAGSGPSLKENSEELKNNKEICLVSCLHNFHFFEDNGTPADFYVSLDAGEVTIEEVYEGGTKTEDEYWALTKNRKLICYIGTSPRLLEKWQGEIYFFNCPIPDETFVKKIDDLELFNCYVSTGGNVLGACLYFAKGYLGANPIAFIGADFCFSYDNKFHGWESKYDAKLGNVLRVTDVFGNKVNTWLSYHNFKGWFEYICMTVPGIYFNCSEGGTLGAYLQGNIRAIIQSPLKDFIRQFMISDELAEQANDSTIKLKKILF